MCRFAAAGVFPFGRMEPMRIFVDADACPVKPEIIAAARQAGVNIVFVMADAHATTLPTDCEVVTVSGGVDAADYALLNRAKAGDIVVTDDYPLASLALAKRAFVLAFRGLRITDGNIDGLMMQRHHARKMRRAGKRVRGPRALLETDRARFAAALDALIEEALSHRGG